MGLNDFILINCESLAKYLNLIPLIQTGISSKDLRMSSNIFTVFTKRKRISIYVVWKLL